MFKKTLKSIVVTLLGWEARLILRKYKPKIVGITGSVGKTSTKEAIAATLGTGDRRVRASAKSYNSELGVPLTVIGATTAWSSFSGWVEVLWQGLKLIVLDYPYPEWLILEVGADRPGDIKRLTKWVKPTIAVLTRLPEIPVHIEFFKTVAAVVNEKMSLAYAVPKHGIVILNADDKEMMAHAQAMKGKVLTYGVAPTADYRITNMHVYYEKDGDRSVPAGTAFKFEYDQNSLPVRVAGVAGEHLAYPYAAALVTGLSQHQNVVTMIEALAELVPPPGRLRLIPGIKETMIIDDSYNSSPAALEAGLATLGGIETTGKKIAVLADMMELGVHTMEAHRAAGRQVAATCQALIVVGLRAKFIAEEALARGMSKENIFDCEDATAAGQKLQELLESGDVALVKGSQSMRMEKVVEEVMLHPEDKAKLLCRQEEEWHER